MLLHKKRVKTDLLALLLITGILLVIGLLFIYSASSVFALEKMGSSHYYFKKQLWAVLLGFIAIVAMRYVPFALIKKSTPILFFGSLLLTALTVITPLGQEIHGSSRWLALPFLSFQPSELLKVFMVLYIAYFISKKENKQSSFIHGYLPFLIILGITAIILLKQPDFGLTVTLTLTAFALLFIAGIYQKFMLATIIGIVPLLIGLILAKSYRLKRILTFLNPWEDPQGAGFQIIQSLIAIGSGGFWGTGIGQSKQKFFYLPMQHTDFIFSIIAEETGFIGSSIVILLFLAFAYFGLRLGLQLKDRFCSIATLGFVIVISLQALINILVATGLAPTKGIGLPFISYGNTALICQLIMIGLIMYMAKENE